MYNLETMPAGNGAGTIKTWEQFERALKSPMTRITIGSITFLERVGNIGDVYYFHPHDFWSLNSLGLPNRGLEYYKTILREMAKKAHDAGKELWVSISPFSPEECGQMVAACLECGVDGVEINGSCPNVWKNGARKEIPALNPPLAQRMFEVVGVYGGADGKGKVSFKLSPTRDESLLKRMATVLQSNGIKRLVCCNAMADQSGMRLDGKPALSFRTSEEDTELKHLGGLGGTPVHDINRKVAGLMKEWIPDAKIIGIGGNFNGADVKDYLDVGCVGWQSTTGYLQFREQLFVDVLFYLAE